MAISCKKEKLRDGRPCIPELQLITSAQRYYHDGTYYTEQYEYDYNLKLKKIENRTQAGALMSFLEYHYVNRKLTGATLNSATKKAAEYKYYYAGTNHPAKYEYLEYGTDNALKLVMEQLYEYNNGGQVIKTTVNYFINNPSYYIVTTYGNGNIIGQKYYDLTTGAPGANFTYEYDNKINPYQRQINAPLDNPRYYSKNNVTKITNNPGTGTGPVVDLVNDYEYRTDGRPAKVYNKYNGGHRTLGMVYSYQ